MTMGIVAVASLAQRVGDGPGGDDDIHIETHKFGHEVGKPLYFSVSPPILNDNVFPFRIA
jgi:hypothetical protein